jgi:hypothetical protein
MTHLAAVLTGDLIGSTQAPAFQLESTMVLLSQTAQNIDDDTRFTRFRGDGWQIYLQNAGHCLWACLLIMARIKAAPLGLATRISVGIGAVSSLGAADLSAAAGPAFTQSGRGLDDMDTAQTLAIRGDAVDRLQKALFAFAAERANRWSREQAEAMALALTADAPSRAAMAQTLGITRQAVDARLSAAGLRLLEEAHLAFVEAYSGYGARHA